jgi:hypothetical protein
MTKANQLDETKKIRHDLSFPQLHFQNSKELELWIKEHLENLSVSGLANVKSEIQNIGKIQNTADLIDKISEVVADLVKDALNTNTISPSEPKEFIPNNPDIAIVNKPDQFYA